MDGKDPNKDKDDEKRQEDMSQLEQDILAKNSGRGSGPSTGRPGASSVNSGAAQAGVSHLSQLEQDIVTKTQAAHGRDSGVAQAPGGSSATPNVNLSRLEQDIAAKTQARGGAPASRPGVVASGAGSGGLSQLEQDILTKTQAAAGGTAASRPGVVNRAGGLSQLEQDIASKTQARGGQPVASRPGAVGGSHLSQLEQDIAAKSQSRAPAASQPGATAAHHLSQLERDIAAKTQASQGSIRTVAPPNAGLSQLEQDVMAKTQARGGGVSILPPAANRNASGMDTRYSDATNGEPLRRLEQEGGGEKTPALTQLEQDVMSKARSESNSTAQYAGVATPPAPHASANLYSLEDDVMAKQMAAVTTRPSSSRPLYNDVQPVQRFDGGATMDHRSTASTSYAAQSYASEEAPAMGFASRNAYHDSEPSGAYVSDRDAYAGTSYASAAASVNNAYDSRFAAAPAPMDHGNYETTYNNYSNDFLSQNAYADRSPPPSHLPQEAVSMPSFAPGVTAEDLYRQDPEAPLYPVHNDSAGGETGGIEAFVADKVVDATGVAVIMSDEEEEIEIKKRQKKFLLLMALGVTVLLVAVIVPVALLTGKEAVVGITPAPTMAPTLSPTMSPTTIEVPKTVESLAEFSSVTTMEDRNSPQGKAVAWIVEDEYVRQQGLAAPHPKFIQRYALAVFYFTVGGDKWNVCHQEDDSCAKAWLKGTDECTWFLLQCDADNMLESMDFIEGQNEDYNKQGTALTGLIPKEIEHLTTLKRLVIPDMRVGGPILDYLGKMSSLVELSLGRSNFNGTIPETFGEEHPNMTTLNLVDNAFSGSVPPTLGRMNSLTILDLSENRFKGPLPTFLGTLPALDILSLGSNSFAGEIPLEYYNSQVKRLQLSNNNLTGTIRTEIGTMNSLTHFEIGVSNMGGAIPTELFMLSTLEVLHIHNASFSGLLLDSDFGKLTAVKDLWLQNNNFNGPIPLGAIESLKNLEEILIQGNELTGTVPDAVCRRRGFAKGEISIFEIPCPGVTCECCDCN